MKHIILGGDGFLGTELSRKLSQQGQQVVIGDIKKTPGSAIYDSPLVSWQRLDVTSPADFEALDVDQEDVIYHFAARLLMPIVPRAERQQVFHQALFVGTDNLLRFMHSRGLKKLIYFTTDMVYGHTREHPRTESHPRAPLGPYGNAKYQSEKRCEEYRALGIDITIFRPRLIIGPGRLGILEKLFKAVDRNLPVPTIGNGRNYYQFISVSDCAEAALAAVEAGIPNEAFNLGSLNPPQVNELLKTLINEAQSRSVLLPTPAFLVKQVLGWLDRLGRPVMDPEQFLIADETCVLDVSKAKAHLSWQPADDDISMLLAAYRSYKEAESVAPAVSDTRFEAS